MMARLTIWLRRVDAQIRFRASEITRRLLRKLIEIAITDLDLMAKFRGLMSSVEFEHDYLSNATTDRDQIKRWWTESPNANIGIATGREAGILVLEMDPRKKGKETLARLKKELGPLPDTVTALTGGGGRHLIFKHPPSRSAKTPAARSLDRASTCCP